MFLLALIVVGSMLFFAQATTAVTNVRMTVLPPVLPIQVTQPNGGETWTIGETADITWTTTNSLANVKIELQTATAGAWTTLADQVTNDGSLTINVPDSSTTQALLKISFVDDPGTYDTSDAVFTIANAGSSTVYGGSGGAGGGSSTPTTPPTSSTPPSTTVPTTPVTPPTSPSTPASTSPTTGSTRLVERPVASIPLLILPGHKTVITPPVLQPTQSGSKAVSKAPLITKEALARAAKAVSVVAVIVFIVFIGRWLPLLRLLGLAIG